MKKKGSSIGGGLLIFLIGICLLWWNEGNNVKNIKSVNEGLKNYKDVKSTKVDSQNEGKLVATNGKLVFTEDAIDGEFNITSKSSVLKRKVEMYQWDEECETDDNDNKTCTYKKVWSDDIIDSSSFEKSGHENPTNKLYESEKFYSSGVKLGAFEMTSNLLEKLSTKKQIKQLDEEVAKSHEMTIDQAYYTNVKENAEIGDIRVSFYENDAEYVSVLAMQSDNHFKVYKTKYGKNFFNLYEEEYNGSDMFKIISKQNNFGKWLWRIVGTLLIIMGVGSLFAPLQRLTGGIPILGSLVGTATGLVSFVAGLSISLIIIALAWFRFRPLLSIVLLLVAVLLLVYLKTKNLRKKEIKSE